MSALNVIEEIRKLEARNSEIDNEITELNGQIEAINETIQERNEEKDRNSQEVLRLRKIKCCPSCGRELPEEAVFCMFCGHKLDEAGPEDDQVEEEEEKPALCPKCGAPLIEGAAFCMECGADVEQYKQHDDVQGEKPEEPEATETPEETASDEGPAEEVAAGSADGAKKVCPTCGIELSPDATECCVCGTPV